MAIANGLFSPFLLAPLISTSWAVHYVDKKVIRGGGGSIGGWNGVPIAWFTKETSAGWQPARDAPVCDQGVTEESKWPDPALGLTLWQAQALICIRPQDPFQREWEGGRKNKT